MFSIKFKTGKQIFPFFSSKTDFRCGIRDHLFSLRQKNRLVFHIFIPGSGKQLLFRLGLGR